MSWSGWVSILLAIGLVGSQKVDPWMSLVQKLSSSQLSQAYDVKIKSRGVKLKNKLV